MNIIKKIKFTSEGNIAIGVFFFIFIYLLLRSVLVPIVHDELSLGANQKLGEDAI